MIHLLGMKLRNFMGYRGKHVIPLSNLGVVRIEAINKDDPGADSNMSGKSTLIEAIVWTLFGKTIRGLRPNEVINHKAKRHCVCELRLEAPGQKHIVVRRSRSPHSLKLTVEGRNISKRKEARTQSKLEEIIGCDYATFVNSTVFGGLDGGRKPFALLTDKEQKKILDSFLRFEKITEALEFTKETLHNSRLEREELQLRLAKQSGKVNSFRARVSELNRGVAVFRSSRLLDKRKLEKRLNALPVLNKPPKRLLRAATKSLETSVEEKAREEARAYSFRERLASISNRKQSWKRMVGKKCPACGQVVREREDLTKHFERDFAELDGALALSLARTTRIERKVSSARKVLKRVQKKYNKRTHFFVVNSKEREELRGQLLKLETTQHEAPLVSKLQSVSRRYSKEMSQLFVYETELRSLKVRIKDLEFWEQGFGNKGVKVLVLRQLLPAMNAKLKEYAQEIFQSNKVELEFKPTKELKSGAEKELLHLRYKSKRVASGYQGESSGGRRRVDICVLLTFAWMSCVSDVILVDEFLDSMDSTGREIALQLLSKQRGTVFVITHERGLKSSIGKVWTVIKKNGESQVET